MLLESDTHGKDRIGRHPLVDSGVSNMPTLMYGVRLRHCKPGGRDSYQPDQGGSDVHDMHWRGSA